MAKQVLNNLEWLATHRAKLNSNFTELYDNAAFKNQPNSFTDNQTISNNKSLNLLSDNSKIFQLRRWWSVEWSYWIFTAWDAIIYSNDWWIKIALEWANTEFAIATWWANNKRFSISSWWEITVNWFKIVTWSWSPEWSITATPWSMFMSDNGNIYRKWSWTWNTWWIAM